MEKTALVLGFKPFGPYRHNPTQEMADMFHKHRMFSGGLRIIGEALPASYDRAPARAIELIEAYSPEIILGLGLFSRINCIRLETTGRNIKTSKYRDVDGKFFTGEGEPIDRNADEYYCTTADEKAIRQDILAAKISVEISNDAEAFVCNTLIFTVARYIEENNLSTKFAHIHTPWTDKFGGMEKIEQGKTIIPAGHLRWAIEIALACMYREVAV